MLERIESIDRDLYLVFIDHLIKVLPETTYCEVEFYIRKPIDTEIEIKAHEANKGSYSTRHGEDISRYYKALSNSSLKISDMNNIFGFNFHPDLLENTVQLAKGRINVDIKYIRNIFIDLYPRKTLRNPRLISIKFSTTVNDEHIDFIVDEWSIKIPGCYLIKCNELFGEYLKRIRYDVK